MQNKSRVHRQRPPADDLVDIGPALDCSPVIGLFGRPYPVQFRNQGAIDAWTRALGRTPIWGHWRDPATLCWQIREEILLQLGTAHPLSSLPGQLIAEDCWRIAHEVSANLKYHLNQGTMIESTAALETLLTNSDVDLSLPMSMVVPPYRAQYLRFGEATMRYLKVPSVQSADRCFDGVFCFMTRHPKPGAPEEDCWSLELVFIIKRQDRYNGHVSLRGETDRGSTTVGEWLTQVLRAGATSLEREGHEAMHAAISYVVRLFLYMALKQARVAEHHEYDVALRRAAGLGERKRAKLLQRSASLYNSILVGPESLPLSKGAADTGSGVAPHWRRGHFRMQPHGAGNQLRKLIFVAPVLIHADQLHGEAPAPKPYRAGAAMARAA